MYLKCFWLSGTSAFSNPTKQDKQDPGLFEAGVGALLGAGAGLVGGVVNTAANVIGGAAVGGAVGAQVGGKLVHWCQMSLSLKLFILCAKSFSLALEQAMTKL